MKIIKLYSVRLALATLLANPLTLTVGASASPLGELSHKPMMDEPMRPNIVFSVDASPSMDSEILITKPYWRQCMYTIPSSLDGGSTGECVRETGSLVYGKKRDGGDSFRFHNGTSWTDLKYIFNNADNAITGGCGTNFESCSDAVKSASDWRLRSDAFNALYYNNSITYLPWKKADGTRMPNASFTAARSNPQPGTTGYSVTKDLTGFVFMTRSQDHGYSSSHPVRPSSYGASDDNFVKDGLNDELDWWDSKRTITVESKLRYQVESIFSRDYSSIPGISCTFISAGNWSCKYGLGLVDNYNGRTVAELKQNVANWYQYHRRRSFVVKAAIAEAVGDNSDFKFGLNFINNNSFTYGGITTSTFVEAPKAGSKSHNTNLLTALNSFDWPNTGDRSLRQGLERVGKYFDGSLSGTSDPITEACQRNAVMVLTDGYWDGRDPSSIGNKDGDSYTATFADVAKKYYDEDLSSLPNKVTLRANDKNEQQHMVTYPLLLGSVAGNLTGGTWPIPALTESGNWGDPANDNKAKIDDLWHGAYNAKGLFYKRLTANGLYSRLTNNFVDISSEEIGTASGIAFSRLTAADDARQYATEFVRGSWTGDLVASPYPAGGRASSWRAAEKLDALVDPANDRNIFTYDGKDGVPFAWEKLTSVQQDDFKKGVDEDKAKARLQYIRGDRSNETGQGGTYSFRERKSLLGDIVHSTPVYVGVPELDFPHSTDYKNMDGQGRYIFPTTAPNRYTDFKNGVAKNRKPMVYVGANDGMLHGFDAETGEEKFAYIPSSVYSTASDLGLHYLTDPDYLHRYYVNATPAIADVYITDSGMKAGPSDAGEPVTARKWRTMLLSGMGSGGRGIFALDVTDPGKFTETDANAKDLVLWEFTNKDDPDVGYFTKPVVTTVNNPTGGRKSVVIFGNGYNADGDGSAKLFIVFLEAERKNGKWNKTYPEQIKSWPSHCTVASDSAMEGLIPAPNPAGGTVAGNWSCLGGMDYMVLNTYSGHKTKGGTCADAGSDCNGLSKPLPIDTDGNGTTDFVYAGDLHGNMWVFDMKDFNLYNWETLYHEMERVVDSSGKSNLMPKIVKNDPKYPNYQGSYGTLNREVFLPLFAAGKNQPITAQPSAAKVTGVKYPLVFFGTGQYLVKSDQTNTDVQSFYGVHQPSFSAHGGGDPKWEFSAYTLSDLVEQTFTVSTFGSERKLTDRPVNYGKKTDANVKAGWMINLPENLRSERVVTRSVVSSGTPSVSFNTQLRGMPNTCSAAGGGYLMTVKQVNGGHGKVLPDLSGYTDKNGDGVIDEDDIPQTHIQQVSGGKFFDRGFPAEPTFAPDGKTIITGGTNCGASCTARDTNKLGASGSVGKRTSWQQLMRP